MMTEELIVVLRELADVLRPLTSTEPNPRRAEWKHDWTEPEPFALAWWVKLLTMAKLIELQGRAITTEQKKYLRTELFGGAGSLRDLWLDVRALGPRADGVTLLLQQRLEAADALFDPTLQQRFGL